MYVGGLLLVDKGLSVQLSGGHVLLLLLLRNGAFAGFKLENQQKEGNQPHQQLRPPSEQPTERVCFFGDEPFGAPLIKFGAFWKRKMKRRGPYRKSALSLHHDDTSFY